VIWLIVAKHMWNAAEQPVSSGLLEVIFNSGVFFKLFYVISGFALFLPIAARAGALGSGGGRWILRRFARITPSYYLALALVLVAYPLLLLPGQVDTRSLGSILAHSVYLQQELYPRSAGFGVDGPVWALSIFALFYLTLPLIARSFHRYPLLWLVGAIAASALWLNLIDALGGNNDDLKQYPLFLQDFALGMAAAWVLVRARRSDRIRGLLRDRGLVVAAVAVAAFAGLLAVTYAAGSNGGEQAPVSRNSELVNAAVPLFFALLVLATALAPSWFQRPLAGRAAAFLAATSYGVFLFHMIGIKFVMARSLDLTGIDAAAAAAGVAAFALAAGYLSFRFIEEPLRRRARGQGQPAPTGGGSAPSHPPATSAAERGVPAGGP
jgi:peptidoglycan/LPS O-acetylase OafA/YrhL